jgi:molecular chaperone Hsp33
VVATLEGDGQVRTVYAEAMQVGEVRGYCHLHKEPNDDRTSPLGKGLLKVQRVLYGKREPVTGIVELSRGDVTTDLGYYLTQSEQIPSAFVIDSSFSDDDRIKQNVGLLVQAMPGARPEDIFRVYDVLDVLERPTEFIDRGYTPEDLLRQVLPGEIDVLGSSPVDFFCRCSADRFKSVLLTLGYDEITGMERQGHNELICQYCNERYLLSEDDFTELKEQLLAKRN